jgi:hypothetical protein
MTQAPSGEYIEIQCKNPKIQCKEKDRAVKIMSAPQVPREGVPKEFRMQYVGRGLYSSVNFIEEAKRIGVQRSTAFHLLSGFEFGDKVLLANWLGGVEPTAAEVFGYFTINGIASTMPENLFKEVVAQLHVVETISSDGHREDRACGFYCIGGSYVITNTMKEVTGKIQEILKREGILSKTYKWFLKGEVTSIKPIILAPAKFSRSIIKVQIAGFGLNRARVKDATLMYIYDYNLRFYHTKDEA